MKMKLRMEPEQVLEQAIQAIRYARNHTDDIEFSPEDGSRSEEDFLCRVLEAVTHLLVAGFGFAMIWYGVALAIRTWAATLPVLDIPGGIEYLPIAVGGLLVALFSLERLVTLLAGTEP